MNEHDSGDEQDGTLDLSESHLIELPSGDFESNGIRLTTDPALPQPSQAVEGTDVGAEPMDLAYLRDLLGVLTNFRVAAFSHAGFGITFHPVQSDDAGSGYIVPLKGRTKEKAVEDEDGQTSSVPVRGFNFKVQDVDNPWKNPVLWPAQHGRVLKFDGTYE